MSTINAVKVVKDSIKLVLTEADLTTKSIGDCVKTPLRKVQCADNLQWQIYWYQTGHCDDAKGHVSIFTAVTAPTVVKSTYSVDGTSIQKTFTRLTKTNWGYAKFANHEELRPLFRDGKLTITCAVEVYVPVPWSFFTTNVFESCEHVATDFTLIVGDQRLETHRHLLSFLSPVFNAMFEHDTVEKKSGMITITDFECSTVTIALDFLYGHEVLDPSIEIIVGVLRFADKYNINFLAFLEHVVLCNISFDTFATILHYAYDCSKNALLVQCGAFYKDHEGEVKDAPGLNTVPHEAIVDVIEKAFDFNDSVHVFRQAHKNDIKIILVFRFEEPLAHSIAESLCVDNYSKVASCASECSSDFLKEKCVQYLNQHWVEVTQSMDFVNMDAETIKEFMTAANKARGDEEKSNEA
uniref:BTB domain-containing protein n=1 Tax=Panagrellus redivivus TaxID=6233 RepID=A0A7E5A201_PANRE